MLRFSTLKNFLLLRSDERTWVYLVKAVYRKHKLRKCLAEREGRYSFSHSLLILTPLVPCGSEESLDRISGTLGS